MSGRRCSTFQGVHIPGCEGCAWYDHRRCTCSPRGRAAEAPDADDPILSRVKALEDRLKALEVSLA